MEIVFSENNKKAVYVNSLNKSLTEELKKFTAHLVKKEKCEIYCTCCVLGCKVVVIIVVVRNKVCFTCHNIVPNVPKHILVLEFLKSNGSF